jgi:L-malate glycosyltransferase
MVKDIDVLFCGNWESNKNIEETVRMAKEIAPDGKIVWFGRSTVPIDGVEVITNPSLDEIPILYNRAKCFLSMSKDEGWGRPVAEAMACGVPRIINENGGNREIEVVPWSNIANQLIKTLWPSKK